LKKKAVGAEQPTAPASKRLKTVQRLVTAEAPISGSVAFACAGARDGIVLHTAGRSRLSTPAECHTAALVDKGDSAAMRLTTSSAVKTGAISRPP
jgi:hypothetical protein